MNNSTATGFLVMNSQLGFGMMFFAQCALHKRSQGGQGARAPSIEMLPMIKMSQKKLLFLQFHFFFSIFTYNSKLTIILIQGARDPSI